MTNLRIWGLVTAVAIIAVLAGGWFLGTQPVLAAAATTESSALNAEAQNQTIQVKLAGLAKLAAKQGEMQAEDKVLRKAVPSILKPNMFVRRLNEVAALDGVTLKSVSPGPSAPYMAPPSTAVAAAPAPTAEGASPSTTPSPDPSAAPATPASTSPSLARTSSLVTSANFTTIPVTVVVSGAEDAVLKFSTDIQDDERVFLVNSLSTSVDENGAVTGTLSGLIYTLKR